MRDLQYAPLVAHDQPRKQVADAAGPAWDDQPTFQPTDSVEVERQQIVMQTELQPRSHDKPRQLDIDRPPTVSLLCCSISKKCAYTCAQLISLTLESSNMTLFCVFTSGCIASFLIVILYEFYK